MSGRLLRSVCTAALATATVLAAVPFASTAVAEPPGGGATPSAAPSAGATTATTVPAAPGPPGAPAAPAVPAAPAAPGAVPESVPAMLTRLQRLYQQSEEAGEAYNATEVALTRRRAATKQLTASLAQARAALARNRADVGQLARAQYHGQSDLSDYLRLLLADDPQHAVDQGRLLARAAHGRAATLSGLAKGEKHADALAAASRKALATQQSLTARKKQQRDTAAAKLRQVTALLAGLSGDQVAQLNSLEQSGTEAAQRKLVDSGALGPQSLTGRTTPSAQGGAALRYAVGQLGKPYEWGAEGPGAFDCSGLTSQSWAHAGRTIPRTSQEQWRQLPRVPLNQLRPGDLVVYFPKATHVAIYLGEGKVVQAPRPGAAVKVSPIAANPLLGAVRPDAAL